MVNTHSNEFDKTDFKFYYSLLRNSPNRKNSREHIPIQMAYLSIRLFHTCMRVNFAVPLHHSIYSPLAVFRYHFFLICIYRARINRYNMHTFPLKLNKTEAKCQNGRHC